LRISVTFKKKNPFQRTASLWIISMWPDDRWNDSCRRSGQYCLRRTLVTFSWGESTEGDTAGAFDQSLS